MNLYKKILFWIVGFLALVLFINFGLNYWVNKHLPKIIFEENQTPYQITYKDLKISLWNSSIKASQINIVPKATLKDSINKAGIYSKIESIAIENFKVWDLIFDNKIKAKTIIVTKPVFILYKKNENAINNSKSINSEIAAPFQKIIVVSNIHLVDGDLKIINVLGNTPILSAKNINFKIEGIVTSDEILKNKIPILFSNYNLSCDSIYYNINRFYTLTANQINTTKTDLSIKKLKFDPKYTRREFTQKLNKEKDLFQLNAESITFQKMDWGFQNEKFYFNTNDIIIDKLNANIYRNKIPADDLSKKYLYNKLLRQIPFKLNVNMLQIKNSQLVYEEEINFKKGPGILTFDKFNLKATNIQNGFNQKKIADLKIKIDCQFMKTSPLKVNWSFNVLDKSDGFNIKGSILNFNSKKITSFLKPNNNVTTNGILDEVRFNFTGNDNMARGSFGLNYRDLKVTIFKTKKPKEISKLKTAIGNLLIKNDSNNEIEYQTIEVERIQEKSFYNFLWRCIGEGLKKSVL
ncbi:hypothetical protein [Flavobacterium sp.]|uniref:hypothetical protein n=1 Tax=Flavobacterium sp. TaxID=239 RepID=UPI003751BD44